GYINLNLLSFVLLLFVLPTLWILSKEVEDVSKAWKVILSILSWIRTRLGQSREINGAPSGAEGAAEGEVGQGAVGESENAAETETDVGTGGVEDLVLYYLFSKCFGILGRVIAWAYR